MTMTTDETVEDTKTLAVDMLSAVLRGISNVEPIWTHHQVLGFNNVVTNIALEIIEPHYGEVTDFEFNILADKDGNAIILYYQPGSSTYGFGVLNENGDVCLAITLSDLVEWIVPTETDYDLSEHIALLHEIITEAQNLIK